MGKADLHGHTRHDAWGDGNSTIEELFHHVEHETDLDIIAITEHDSTDAAREAQQIHRRGNYRFHFLPGVEVTNLAGHLLCYFPSGEIHDIPSLRPFWSAVRYAQARGAICIAAHPVYPPWLVPTIDRGLRRGLKLDGMETVNTGIPASGLERLKTIGPHFEGRVASVGNSDAHDLSALGSAYTEFPGSTIEDFLHALAQHQTRPVFVRRTTLTSEHRAFTTRRSITRPGWVRNVWREIRSSHGAME